MFRTQWDGRLLDDDRHAVALPCVDADLCAMTVDVERHHLIPDADAVQVHVLEADRQVRSEHETHRPPTPGGCS